MSAILPLLCFFFMFIRLQKLQFTDGWRCSFLLASVFEGFFIVLITELIGIFKWINFWTLLLSWVLGLVLLIFLLKDSEYHTIFGVHDIQNFIRSTSRFDLISLIGISFIIIAIALVSGISPPNTWDSMTYHMSRVVHWIQNGSIEFYPTHIPRQLHQNPWSEYTILTLLLLSGGDHLSNFIQWFSLVGCIVGVSLIAKKLGADRHGQILASVVCATIPMGILQASSTQTDYVVSFWLVCFVYFSIIFTTKPDLFYAIGFGLGLGLAILTKATAYLYAFPFLIWLCLFVLQHATMRKMRLVILGLILAFSVNLGHYGRNYDLYRSPLGPNQEAPQFSYSNEIFTLSFLLSNILRNTALHMSTPNVTFNRIIESAIYKSHMIIGLSPNDPRTTWATTQFHINKFDYHEDTTGNPIHLMIIMISLVVFIGQKNHNREIILYISSLLLAIILFSSYLKWQPWNSRLHLPLFVLFSSPIGLIVSKNKFYWLKYLIVAILLASSLSWLLYNTSRPILGENSVFIKNRVEQYFANRPSLYKSYAGAAEVISDLQCSDIGLIIHGDDWEYPLWVLLREKSRRIIRLEHVAVTNDSQKYNENYLSTFKPCALFVINTAPSSTLLIKDVPFFLKWSADSVAVYTPIR